MSNDTALIRVTEVEPLEGFELRLRFSDETERFVDLGPELWGPVFEPLKQDLDLFRQVRVEDGSIAWPGGADMDADVLHGSRDPA
jgi:hypothetical protein